MTQGLRVYVAGPIESAGGNMNWPLFAYVAKQLRATGCEVFCPTEHAEEVIGPLEIIQKLDKATLKEFRKRLLKEELAWICDYAQLVVLLAGWERSRGAVAERALAVAIDIPIRDLGTIIVPPDDDEPLDFSGIKEEFTSIED